MSKALKTLRVVQWVMLASILIYVALGEVLSPQPRAVNPSLSYVFTTVSVAIVGVIFVVRRTIVLPAAASLATRPEDILSLNHWRAGYLVTYCLCEALALFGVVQRFMGGGLRQSAPYYLGGFVLMFFFRAQRPERASTG